MDTADLPRHRLIEELALLRQRVRECIAVISRELDVGPLGERGECLEPRTALAKVGARLSQALEGR